MVLSLALAGAGVAQEDTAVTGAPPELTYPRPLGSPALPAPVAIRHLLGPGDTVLVRMRIGTAGEVIDFVPLDLPHRDLLDRVEDLVPLMRFLPGMDNGTPYVADIDVRIPVTRSTDLGVVSESIANHVESQMLLMNPEAYRLKVSTPRELDAPMQLVESGQQVVAVDAEQNVMKGAVEVEFHVDPHGVPRLVKALGDPPPALAEAATRTVANFRFSPPLHNGYPTVVKGRITIRQGG